MKSYYEAPGAVRRFPGETFADFAARQRASQLAAKPALKGACPECGRKRGHKIDCHRYRQKTPGYVESYEDRLDDIGLSPDF
jgi:hypothetical protein